MKKGFGRILVGLAGAVFLLLALGGMKTVSKAAGNTWPESFDSVYSTTSEFLISTVEDLESFRVAVASGKTFAGKTVSLANDLTFNDISNYGSWSDSVRPANVFIGIGPDVQVGGGQVSANNYLFKGTFDGKGRTITGLYIYAGKAQDINGFFTQVYNATIKDVTFENSYVYSNSTTWARTGLVTGSSNTATFENVTVTTAKISTSGATTGFIGSLGGYFQSATKVTNCHSDAEINGIITPVGGLFGGANDGAITMESSSFSGTVQYTTLHGTSGYKGCGLLVGAISGSRGPSSIKACEATGEILGSTSIKGGFIGGYYSSGNLEISDSTSSGTITGTTNLGGIVGWYECASNLTLTRVMSSGTINGQSQLGGFVSAYFATGNLTITDSNFNGTITGTTNLGGIVGWYHGASNLTLTRVTSSGTINGQSQLGGFIGQLRAIKSLTATDCIFKGTIAATSTAAATNNCQQWGGFVGQIRQDANQIGMEITRFMSYGTLNFSNAQREGGANLSMIIGFTENFSVADYSAKITIDSPLILKNISFNPNKAVSLVGAIVGQQAALKIPIEVKNYLVVGSSKYNKSGTMTELPLKGSGNGTLTSTNEAGIEKNPYQLPTVRALTAFSEISKTDSFTGKYLTLKKNENYILNEDYANSAKWSNSNAPANRWRGIGCDIYNSAGYLFKGILDGQNAIITGLFIGDGQGNSSAGNSCPGFITTLGGGTLKNLNFSHCMINLQSGGNSRIGLVTGVMMNGGKIDHVTVDDTCRIIVGRTGQWGVGGFAGNSWSPNAEISNSTFSGTITSSTNLSAGFVGKLQGTGSIAFSGSTFDGTVNAGGTYTGGFIGGSEYEHTISVTNCTSSGTITSSNNQVGGFIGGFYTAANGITVTFTNASFEGNISQTGTGSQAVGGFIGDVGVKTTVTIQGTSTSSGTISIEGWALGGFIGRVMNQSGTVVNIENAKVTATLSSTRPNPVFVGGFIGRAQGGSITISGSESNVTISQADVHVGGFIATIDNAAVVTIENSKFTGSITSVKDATRSAFAGGFIGIDASTGQLAIRNSLSSGAIRVNNLFAGGFIGYIGAYTNGDSAGTQQKRPVTIEHCLFTGKVTSNRYNAVSGATCTGGFVGSSYSSDSTGLTISDCLAAGQVIYIGTDANYFGNGGSVIGQYRGKLTLDNVYALADTCLRKESESGQVVGTLEKIGNPPAADYRGATGTIAYLKSSYMNTIDLSKGENAYKYSSLNTTYWTFVADKTPVLTLFRGNTAPLSLPESIIRADYDWYHFGADDSFTLADEEDLMGFQALSWLGGMNFTGKTVNLVENKTYDLNPGWNAVAVDRKVPANIWYGIGGYKMGYQNNANCRFNGTFEGNGATISGVYLSTNLQSCGFFTMGNSSTVIQNFTLANSYFETKVSSGLARFGAVMGVNAQTTSTISGVTVASSTIVKASGSSSFIGGIIGQAWGVNQLFDNTFAGRIEVENNGGVGGIIGVKSETQTVTYSGNRFTGSISVSDEGSNIGGIIGAIGGQNAPNVTISGGESTGTITAASAGNVGGVVGRIDCQGTATVTGITVTATITGMTNVGGIVGCVSESGLLNISNSTVGNSTDNATLCGRGKVGGAVGRLETTNTNFNAISSSTFKVTITGRDYVDNTDDKFAGVVGYLGNGKLNVTDLTVEGRITAGDAYQVAGIVGAVSGATTELNIDTVTVDMNLFGYRTVAGVAGLVQAPITVQNATVAGTYEASTGSTEGQGINTSYVGGIIGQYDAAATSAISNVKVDADLIAYHEAIGGIAGGLSATGGRIDITDATVSGTIIGSFRVGGFVGYMTVGTTLNVTDSQFIGGIQNQPDDLYYRNIITYTNGNSEQVQRDIRAYRSEIASLTQATIDAILQQDPGAHGFTSQISANQQRFGGIVGDMQANSETASYLILEDVRIGGSLTVLQADGIYAYANLGSMVGLTTGNDQITATRVLSDCIIISDAAGTGSVIGQLVTNVTLDFTDVFVADDSACITLNDETTYLNPFVNGAGAAAATNKVTEYVKADSLGGDGYKTFKNLGFIENNSTWFLAEDSTPLLRKFKGEADPAVFSILVTSGAFNTDGKDRQSVSAQMQAPVDMPTSDFTKALNFSTSGVEHYKFLGWYVNIGKVETPEVDFTKLPLSENLEISFKTLEAFLNSDYFTGDSEMSLVAAYRLESGNESAEITIEAEDFTYQIGLGTLVPGSGKVTFFAPIGSTLTVTFGESESLNFYGWYNESGCLLGRETKYGFTVLRNDTVTAKSAEKKESGALVTFVSNSNQIVSSAYYESADAILFPTNQYSYGMQFVGWTLDGIRYDTEDAARDAIREAMTTPGTSLYLKASFRYTDAEYHIDVKRILADDLSNISPENALALGETIQGTVYKLGAIANLSTDADWEGHPFRFYINEDGEILSYSKDFRYRGMKTETIYAVYSDSDTNTSPVLLLTGLDHVDQGNGKHTYTAIVNRSVPEEFEITDQGIIAFVVTVEEDPTNNLNEHSSIQMAKDYLMLEKVGLATPEDTVLFRYQSTNVLANNSTTLNLKNVPNGEGSYRIVYVKGYMTYRDSEGVITTIYTNLGQSYLDNLAILSD